MQAVSIEAERAGFCKVCTALKVDCNIQQHTMYFFAENIIGAFTVSCLSV